MGDGIGGTHFLEATGKESRQREPLFEVGRFLSSLMPGWDDSSCRDAALAEGEDGALAFHEG